MTDTQFYIIMALGVCAAIMVFPYFFRAVIALVFGLIILAVVFFGFVALMALPLVFIGYRLWVSRESGRSRSSAEDRVLGEDQAMRMARDGFAVRSHDSGVSDYLRRKELRQAAKAQSNGRNTSHD